MGRFDPLRSLESPNSRHPPCRETDSQDSAKLMFADECSIQHAAVYAGLAVVEAQVADDTSDEGGIDRCIPAGDAVPVCSPCITDSSLPGAGAG